MSDQPNYPQEDSPQPLAPNKTTTGSKEAQRIPFRVQVVKKKYEITFVIYI